MDSLDIQVVDSLTVNLNQEDYSTEGQILNDIAVYVEDEQLLFDAALTLDSINLYTRETSDIISFDTKGIMDGISKLESLIEKTSKEATLKQGVQEIKGYVENIDFSAIAKENTLLVESKAIKDKIDNIKLPEIDTTELASKELERFWDVVPEDSEEIISEEDIHAAVEDIWNTTFNS